MSAAWRRPAAWACAAVVLASGCTYDTREPGLFRTREPTTQRPVDREDRSEPLPTYPDLPVAGERLWVSGYSELPVTFRFAVHAVRRIEGATVLDWSITPVGAPGYGFGDRLPSLELGLETPAREAAGVLIDPQARRAYQPLRHERREEFNHCLCTPLLRLEQDIRLGETTVLQTAFPALPDSLAFVDVSLTSVAPFRHVPVSPLGTAPTALAPTDLARPGEPGQAGQDKIDFRNPSRSEQFQWIRVSGVVVSPGQASLEWTLTSVTDQASRVLDYGPPVSSRPPDGVEVTDANAASGPILRTGRASLAPEWTRTTVNNRPAYDCLCSGIGLWAAGLRNAGVSARLVTNYPALPAGVRTVDVEFPGFGTFRGIPAETAEDAATLLGPSVPVETGTWTYTPEALPYGWPTAEWPTDTPDAGQLHDYTASVEPIVPLPPGPS